MQNIPASSRISGAALLTGVATCLSLIVLFGLLSAGIGLVGEGFNFKLFLPLLALTIIIPFIAAGYVTALATGGRDRVLHAGTVWGLVTVILTLLIGSQTSAIAGGALKQLGMASGADVGASAMIDQIVKLNPKLVTDVEIHNRKATTHIELNRRPASMTHELTKAARKEAESTVSGATSSPRTEEVISEAGPKLKAGAEATTWAAFASLVVALGAILIGARLVSPQIRTS